jgi:spore maturation protein CgeB
MTPESARKIGLQAQRRILAAHTYDHRAEQVEQVLGVFGPAGRGVAT